MVELAAGKVLGFWVGVIAHCRGWDSGNGTRFASWELDLMVKRVKRVKPAQTLCLAREIDRSRFYAAVLPYKVLCLSLPGVPFLGSSRLVTPASNVSYAGIPARAGTFNSARQMEWLSQGDFAIASAVIRDEKSGSSISERVPIPALVLREPDAAG
jgi:hypothetical protein